MNFRKKNGKGTRVFVRRRQPVNRFLIEKYFFDISMSTISHWNDSIERSSNNENKKRVGFSRFVPSRDLCTFELIRDRLCQKIV